MDVRPDGSASAPTEGVLGRYRTCAPINSTQSGKFAYSERLPAQAPVRMGSGDYRGGAPAVNGRILVLAARTVSGTFDRQPAVQSYGDGRSKVPDTLPLNRCRCAGARRSATRCGRRSRSCCDMAAEIFRCAGRVGRVVQIAVRVGRLVVDRRRNHAVAQGQQREASAPRRRWRPAGGPTGSWCWRCSPCWACSLEDRLDGGRFGLVAQRRAGAVGVDVADARRGRRGRPSRAVRHGLGGADAVARRAG